MEGRGVSGVQLCAEKRIWRDYPGRVRQATRTESGDPLPDGWLTEDVRHWLQVLGAPVREALVICAFEQGGTD